MATVAQTLLIPETRFVLAGISWNMYEMLRESEENQGVRMTYDDVMLELMSRVAGQSTLNPRMTEN